MRSTTRQDVLLAAVALAGGVAVLGAHGYTVWDETRWNPGPLWRLVPLLGVCAAMLFRRTAALAALAIATPMSLLDVVFGPCLATMLIYTDALYAATLYGRRRTAGRLLVTTVGAALVLGLGVGLWDRNWRSTVVVIAFAGMTWVGPVLTAMVVRGHRDRAELERQRAELERQRAGELARLADLDRHAAVAAERARMARELHDVVANHLSAVALHSSALLRLPGLDAAQTQESLGVIRENSVQGLAEMRRMIGLLRAGDGDDAVVPRLHDLGSLVDRAGRPDLRARLEVAGTPAELPAPIELAAYRIVQESLTNALKHAGPGTAEVRVEHRPERLLLTVTSPLGRPAAQLPGGGAGLVGMRERVSILGGTFDAGPRGATWTVHAELPADLPPADRTETTATAGAGAGAPARAAR